MTIYDKIAAIQDEIQNITKDAKNPHFGNTYATYEKVMEVLHPILRKHHLVALHTFGVPTLDNQIPVTTTLKGIYEDNDELSTTLYIPMIKVDPQAAGSAITYAKRYSILAMLGLGTEDDDANSASKTEIKPIQNAPTTTSECLHAEFVVRQVMKEGPNKGRYFKVCKDCNKFSGWMPQGAVKENANGDISYGSEPI